VELELLDLFDLKANPENFTPSTTIDVGLTDTSFPEMMAALAKADLAPAGRLRGGVLPVGNPPAPVPPLRTNAPPRPPKPEVQLPEADGCATVTERAVTVEPDVVPTTVTQDPSVSDDTVRVPVLENLVEAVQVTVVCPDVGFCTSIEVPEMAATEPDVPWKARPPGPPVPLDPR
jgi:hypothetical protein